MQGDVSEGNTTDINKMESQTLNVDQDLNKLAQGIKEDEIN